jgi:hypothetical protein
MHNQEDFRKVFLVKEAIPERSTYQYRAALTLPSGAPVEPGQLTSILATLRDVASDTIVNGRDAQEVLGQNGGSVTTGLFVLQFAESDTAILGSASAERRVLTLDLRLTGGGRVTREVHFYVANFADIAA